MDGHTGVANLFPEVRSQQRIPQTQDGKTAENGSKNYVPRIQERIIEEIIDVPMQQVMKESVEAVKLTPEDRISDRIIEQILDVAVPDVREQHVGAGETMKHIAQELVQNRAVEHFVGVSVPQIRKKAREVIQLVPQERIFRTHC